MNPDNINKLFNMAVDYIHQGLAAKQFPNKSELSDDNKLKFYGLYKTATIGHNNTEKPGMLDFVGRAKWDAWNKCSSMSIVDARLGYIKLLYKLAPDWDLFYEKYLMNNPKKN